MPPRGLLALVLPAALLAAGSGPSSPLDLADRPGRGHGTDLDRIEVIRAAPFASDPLHALPRLVALAGSRDPNLAPAAAVAIHRIVFAAEPSDAARVEMHPSELAEVRNGLLRVARDPGARGDIRYLAATSARMLEGVASD